MVVGLLGGVAEGSGTVGAAPRGGASCWLLGERSLSKKRFSMIPAAKACVGADYNMRVSAVLRSGGLGHGPAVLQQALQILSVVGLCIDPQHRLRHGGPDQQPGVALQHVLDPI